MSYPLTLQSVTILSSRIVNSRLLDIRGISLTGVLDIELVHHPDIRIDGDDPDPGDDDLLLSIEEFRAGLMDWLGDTEMAWLKTPLSGVYSLEVRQNGSAVLFWLGRADRRG
ncbi:hypothetical protein [Desulfoplanes sp.]